MYSPTGLIPWFSKTEGNTYATLLHHPFLFKGKPTHAQEVAATSNLPSGLVLDLNNCYLVPALSMNIISGSCLMRDGYSFKSENNGCSIYMNNIFYDHAPLKSGLFLLNLDSSDKHIHNIEAKRCKVNNDSATYLWHCRLGHIGVKRMKKLHADGLLESLGNHSSWAR